jgi:hypothetical protein
VTLLGNFDDYVLKQRGLPGSGVSATLTRVEKFNVINLHATGGGIRCAGSSSGGVFDCTVTANKGISLYNNDAREAGSYFGAFDYSIENCSVNAGANYSGSFGIASPSDGPITNCRVIGYEWGFLTAGGEGAQVLLGCYFEKCGTAIALGRAPDAGTFSASGVVVAGCWIKDCGIGFNAFASTSLATVIGLRIEGTNGQAPGGTNPQYGIYKGMSYSMLAGITIVGQFDVAGLYMAGVPFFINGPNLIGVSDSATSPNPFDLDASGGNGFIATQIACSAKHIYTVATIPDPVTGITDPGLFTGQQVNVSDGTNGLNWGDTLTGTGTHTTHYAAQWNGSAWTVLGK